MPSLTAYAANLHNERAAVRMLHRRSDKRRFDAALVSEAQKRRRGLKLTPRHNYHTGAAGSTGDAARETGILLARDLPDYGGGSYFLSAPFPGAPRVGKERWGQVRLTELDGLFVALIVLHPVAAPDALQKGDGGPLPQRHKAAIRWLDATIAHHVGLGHEVIVGGDVNVRQHWDGAARLNATIERHGLHGLWDGLDLLMATPGLEMTASRVERGVLHDHPLLSGTFAPRTTNRK